VGRLADACAAAWDPQFPFIKGYMHYNTSAMGKIYEQLVIVMYNDAIGKLTADECVKEMTKQTIKLKRKFGELPSGRRNGRNILK